MLVNRGIFIKIVLLIDQLPNATIGTLVFLFNNMAKDPAFLFYSSDFTNGVSDLTYEERGQYITMLCIQHQKGFISSKWLSINLPNASSDVLSKFKIDENGNYYNSRLQDEISKRSKYVPKKKAAAILGGLISANKVSKDHSKKIRHEFNINEFIELSESEMKLSISKWFKHVLNLLENENEDINKINKREYIGEFKNVFLSKENTTKLKSEFGISGFKLIVEKLSAYKYSTGKKYKSDIGAIRSWVIDQLKDQLNTDKPKTLKIT